MALNPLRLRRTLSLTTLTTLHHRALSVPNPTRIPAITSPISNFDLTPLPSLLPGIFQSRWFRSSRGPLSSPRQLKLYKEGDDITEDTVLFEGCDYNHWLIVVDFPKDNKPPPEEMVRTYENICAQGLNISVEEAKKRIYACSTTTYEGFQVLMSEEESERFNDVPGVVFVLPDSYIDPVKKEYGGDKYENGVITPRPPPIQYGRNQGGRYRQQNRNTDQPRYDRPGNAMQNQPGNVPPGNMPYNKQSIGQGDGRNFRPSQNYPPQQQPPMNSRDYASRGSDPAYEGSYNQGGQGNYNAGQRRDFVQGEQRNYVPPEQRDFRGEQRIVPLQGGNHGQGPSSGYGQNFGQGANPGYGQNFGQRANPGFGMNPGQGANPGYGVNPGQGANPGYGVNPGPGANPSFGMNPGQGANPGYGVNPGQGANPGYGVNPGQGANPGYGVNPGQGANPGLGQNYGPGATASSGQGYGQRENPGYGQTYSGHGAGQEFSQAEQRNVQGEPTGSMGQRGMQQGR